MIDPISKVSGYASRHVSLCTFIMHKHLQSTSQLWSTDESFKTFNNHKPSHAGVEHDVLFVNLPKAFLDDVCYMFAKHFVRKWASTKLLHLTLASIPKVSRAFAWYTLNKPVENEIVKCNLYKDKKHLPLFTQFITKDADLNEMKK